MTPTAASKAARDHTGLALVALAPLLYVYMPRPPIGGAHRLVIPIIAAVLSLAVLAFVVSRKRIDRSVVYLLLLLLLLSMSTAVSFFFNAPELRLAATLELARPVLFGVFLLFGYYVSLTYGEPPVRKGLLLAAYAILIGQCVIAAAQVFGFSAFGLLYSEEKTRPIGTILRATGSLGNPNIFAWVVAQATVIVYVFKPHRYLAWVLLGGMLILLSGSRTMLLLYPFILAFVGIMRSRHRRWTSYLKGAAVGVLALVALLTCVIVFSELFRYLAELRYLMLSGSLDSINSFAKRMVRWADTYEVFSRGGGVGLVFGLGSRDVTRMMDNDFLYVFFRLGIVGFVVHAAVLIYAARLLRQSGSRALTMLGSQFLLFALLLGLLFETLGGWNFPMLLFFYVGLGLGLTGRVSSDALGHRQPHRSGAAVAKSASVLHHASA